MLLVTPGSPGTGCTLRTAVAGLALAAVVLLGSACSQPPVREVVELDTSLPVGKVEEDRTRFTGIRIPLTLDTGDTGWVVDTKYPEFLLDQGYEKPGLDASQVFAWDPESRSNLQISFSPAGPHDVFSQKSMEWLATVVAGSVEDELDEDLGAGSYTLEQGTTTAYSLTGVPYAARNHARYRSDELGRENGWIYAFAEPFQIFILYQLNGPELDAEWRQAEKVLDSFRYTGP